MIGDLVSGRPASEIFGEMMGSDESLTARDVSRLLAEEFPKLDSAAIQFIRRWRGFGHRDNIEDSVLDLAVRQFLVEAGYRVETKSES